jgi:hypothetical protein
MRTIRTYTSFFTGVGIIAGTIYGAARVKKARRSFRFQPAISFELCQSLHIRLKFREKGNYLAQESAQRVVEEWRARQGITHSGALPSGTDQISGAQNGELAGNARLRKPQHLLQVANVEASNPQKVDKAQTRGISQSFE